MNDVVHLFYFRYRCYYLMLFIYFHYVCKHNHFVCIDVMQTMLFSEFTDLPHVHRCCGAWHYKPCCTYVIVQGHYLFIFSSGMDCNNPSHRCGRLYFPMFLFNVGLLTLMYMASLLLLPCCGIPCLLL